MSEDVHKRVIRKYVLARAFSGGFFWNRHIRMILHACGYDVCLGLFQKVKYVVVWGRRPVSERGIYFAKRNNKILLSVEDTLLRSIQTGRSGDKTYGLMLDDVGIYFDGMSVSKLENLLENFDFDDQAILERSAKLINLIKETQLSKYNNWDDTAPDLPSEYVLVVDQTFGDASIKGAGASADSFVRMLKDAKQAHPDKKILIKSHPEQHKGQRSGYFGAGDCDAQVSIISKNINPWILLKSATEVYTVCSQLGFEAILADTKPNVYGVAFYTGWGLTKDQIAVPRRTVKQTKESLAAAVYFQYSSWFNPYNEELCEVEDVVELLKTERNAHEFAKTPSVAVGMSLWKRKNIMMFLSGKNGKTIFINDMSMAIDIAKDNAARIVAWASKLTDEDVKKTRDQGLELWRMEDGFIRSVGLGAELTPAVSLILDDLGIYYDPRYPSRLETWIKERAILTNAQTKRIKSLLHLIVSGGVTKYNLDGKLDVELPKKGMKILVPGQVEDDASILTGTDKIRTNLGLLKATRAQYPDAILIYKPHPDVTAGLRKGIIPDEEAFKWADFISDKAPAEKLIDAVDRVATMTSLLGFEALMRGKAVTCFGMPFYAGWGLTEDIGIYCERRKTHNPTLLGLAYATYIDYPKYVDPVTQRPCPPEVIIERLIQKHPKLFNAQTPILKLVSKLQGWLSGFSHLWR